MEAAQQQERPLVERYAEALAERFDSYAKSARATAQRERVKLHDALDTIVSHGYGSTFTQSYLDDFSHAASLAVQAETAATALREDAITGLQQTAAWLKQVREGAMRTMAGHYIQRRVDSGSHAQIAAGADLIEKMSWDSAWSMLVREHRTDDYAEQLHKAQALLSEAQERLRRARSDKSIDEWHSKVVHLKTVAQNWETRNKEAQLETSRRMQAELRSHGCKRLVFGS